MDERDGLSAMVGQIADRLEGDLDGFVRRVEGPVLARFDARFPGMSAALLDTIRTGVAVAIRDSLARLRPDAELSDTLAPELIRLARLRGEQRSEWPDLGEVWLVAAEAFWDCFAEMAERVLHDTRLCWDVVKAAREQLNGHAARTYRLFRLARNEPFTPTTRPCDSSQLDTISQALRGMWVDADVLGYNLANSHIALVADASSPLHALADRTERQVLQVRAPGGLVWGWLGGPTRLSDAEFDELLKWQHAGEWQLAFGEPAEGLAGFSASHQQALEARSIAAATGDSVVRFADVRLLIAVLRDRQLATGFVERELGDLQHASERMSELRATLRVYLEQGQSVSATAALRHRDRKTIQRQLRSAERLMSHYVRDRSDELLVALRAAEILRCRRPLTDVFSPQGWR